MALMSPITLCEITPWQQLVTSSELAETGSERAGNSHLKSDMENVILLSQQMNLRIWGSMLSKRIRHHDLWKHQIICDLRTERKQLMLTVIHPVFIVDPLTCYEIICYSNWTTGNNKVKSWCGGQSQQAPNNVGVTQDTGWGQGIPGWCSWVCLGNDWANRGQSGFPLLAPALCPH